MHSNKKRVKLKLGEVPISDTHETIQVVAAGEVHIQNRQSE